MLVGSRGPGDRDTVGCGGASRLRFVDVICYERHTSYNMFGVVQVRCQKEIDFLIDIVCYYD